MAQALGAAGRVLTEHEGRFRFDQLAPGASFEVSVETHDGRSAARSGVRSGGEVGLQLPPRKAELAARAGAVR